MGHEPTGVVVKMGPAVTACSPGEPAAIEPAVYCYRCEFCLAGYHNLCANMRFYSSPGEPGFFREYVNVPVESILPLPDGVGFVQGTLFEPLAVVLESMKLAALNPLETAAVFGAGPIGLMTILMLKMRGAGRIWTVEPVPHRREMARATGAEPDGTVVIMVCAATSSDANPMPHARSALSGQQLPGISFLTDSLGRA